MHSQFRLTVGARLTRRQRVASLVKVEDDVDLIQLLTDCMANASPVQLEYIDTGWRTVVPYGWYVSKDGNLLVYCYKNGMDIRSYRFDRITQLYVDESMLNGAPEADLGLAEMLDYRATMEDYQMPALPNLDEVLQLSETEQGEEESPFEDGIDALNNALTEPPAISDTPIGIDNNENNNADEEEDEQNAERDLEDGGLNGGAEDGGGDAAADGADVQTSQPDGGDDNAGEHSPDMDGERADGGETGEDRSQKI